MSEENNKKGLEALEKIQEILDGVRHLFPETAKSVNFGNSKRKPPVNPLKVLKRVQGIITNYNEDNAESKLKSLFAFLKAISNRKE